MTSDAGYKDDKFGMPVSVTIASLGIITNAVSINFFLRRKNRNLGDKLLVLLNLLDITICISSVVGLTVMSQPYLIGKERNKSQKEEGQKDILFLGFFEMLVELSGIATCFLCALRCIAINWPLYQISNPKVYISAVLVAAFMVTGKCVMVIPTVTDYYEDKFQDGLEKSKALYVSLINVSLMVIFVLFCSIYSIKALNIKRPEGVEERSDTNKKATKMVLILGLLFVTFNLAWVSMLVYFISQDKKTGTKKLMGIMTYIVITINSASNPIVYMTRNEEMNKYVKKYLSKVMNVICKPCSFYTAEA